MMMAWLVCYLFVIVSLSLLAPGRRHRTSPFAPAMLGTIMEQSMLHLLHCFLLVHHVLCSTTLTVCDFGCFRGSGFSLFDVGRFYNHVAALGLSTIGDHVSFFFTISSWSGTAIIWCCCILAGLTLALLHSSLVTNSAETVVYINIRVQREGLNKGVLEGERYGDRSITPTKPIYSLVERGDVEVV